VRLAEQVLLADHLSDGRLVLGIGRGLSEAEFEGLRVPFEESRGRFAEHAELLLQALKTGVIEGGELTRQPRRELRPRPFKPFDGRVFSASASPESAPLIARLGLGTMFIVKRPERLEQDIAPHRAAWSEHHGRDTPLPPPLLSAAVVVDESEDRALEMAQKSDRARRRVSDRHYGVVRAAPVPDLPPVSLIYGTPDQVLKRFEELKSVLGMQGVLTIFPGIPDEDGERSMDCFARHCLPELKSWPAESTF
jgi:alkanesulfonate monooxygenase SsuD/methylene tetrahydromethanopterin reductase-like flavin-dependent oxidoreductase (luciferase family)